LYAHGSDEIMVALLFIPTQYLRIQVWQLPISLLQHRLLLFHVLFPSSWPQINKANSNCPFINKLRLMLITRKHLAPFLVQSCGTTALSEAADGITQLLLAGIS